MFDPKKQADVGKESLKAVRPVGRLSNEMGSPNRLAFKGQPTSGRSCCQEETMPIPG